MQLEPLDARTMFAFGSLDPSFGENGHVATLHEAEYVRTHRTLVLSNGRTVVAGIRENGDDRGWAVRKYLANGKPDKSFGDNGKFTFGNLVDEAEGIAFVAEAADGGLFIAGKAKLRSEDDSSDDGTVLVAKLTRRGTVDSNFLAFGASNVHRPGFFRVGDGVMSNVSGGKLLVANNPSWKNPELLFSRYKPNGQLDKTFGSGGRLSGLNLPIPTATIEPSGKLPFSYRGNAGITALAEAPDGSTVAAGYYVYARGAAVNNGGAGYVSASLPYFIRISATGQVINTRVYTLDIDKGQTSRYRGLSLAPQLMKITADGKIYVHGGTGVIVRLNPDFSLDRMWSDDGIASVIAPHSDPRIGEFAANLADMEVQSDGSVLGVVMGSLRAGGPGADNPVVLRFGADGTTQAAATLGVPPGAPPAGAARRTLNSVEIASDGTILVAGESMPLARVFREDAPVQQVNRGDAHNQADAGSGGITGIHAASGYRFGNVWHDNECVTGSVIERGDLQVLTPGGGRMNARVISKTQRPDGSVLVRYRTSAAHGRSGDDGSHTSFHVLGSRLADVAGALAAGRTLGTFSVRVSQPILSTAEVAVGLSRDRASEQRVH
ncbi:MAG TPA: hypothetical protein VGR35_00620 [Tepidisphaeraceae bacterium]|nr:hypothetical protein [Tepidisphaeraceae bacterium]